MSIETAISTQELSYVYPEGRQALDRISWSVSAGERVGLVGPNGAGKTTFFLCLTGVLSGVRGSVRVMGLDPSNPAERRRLPASVGIVFQNSDDQLFSATVFDDVAFGPLNLGLPPDEVRIRVSDALAQVGMTGCEKRTPLHLSGGEKRRVGLAGVLAMRPAILLLDEPSIYLDPRGRRELIRFINALDVTRVIASHDLELILQTCARTVVLDQGRIVADGPSATILGDAKLMDAHGLEVPHSLTPHAVKHHYS